MALQPVKSYYERTLDIAPYNINQGQIALATWTRMYSCGAQQPLGGGTVEWDSSKSTESESTSSGRKNKQREFEDTEDVKLLGNTICCEY